MTAETAIKPDIWDLWLRADRQEPVDSNSRSILFPGSAAIERLHSARWRAQGRPDLRAPRRCLRAGDLPVTILLTGVTLVAYLGLGVWSPWKNSDYPLLWLALTGICVLAFVTFGARLTR